VFVAFDGPALFGSATLVQYDFSDRPNLEAWLINLYVTPSMPRQGIGTALVSAVEEEARRSNVS
jgi:GNAT superfamily N-acetyltransferase